MSGQKILVMNRLDVETTESETTLGGWRCSAVGLEKRRVTHCLSNSDCHYLLGNDLQCSVSTKGVIKSRLLIFWSCNWTNLRSAMWREAPISQNASESYGGLLSLQQDLRKHQSSLGTHPGTSMGVPYARTVRLLGGGTRSPYSFSVDGNKTSTFKNITLFINGTCLIPLGMTIFF